MDNIESAKSFNKERGIILDNKKREYVITSYNYKNKTVRLERTPKVSGRSNIRIVGIEKILKSGIVFNRGNVSELKIEI